MRKLNAKDIMTKDILMVQEDWSIQRLVGFFTENSVSGAPVISQDDKLVGVVSLTDIIRNNVLSEKDPQSYEPHEYYIHALERQYARGEITSLQIKTEPTITVYDIMTPTVFKVNEEATVQRVADTLLKNRIHRVFVTHNDKVVGVISTVDMLKIIRNM